MEKITFQKVQGNRATWFIPVAMPLEFTRNNIWVVPTAGTGYPFAGSTQKFECLDGTTSIFEAWNSNYESFSGDTRRTTLDYVVTTQESWGMSRGYFTYEDVCKTRARYAHSNADKAMWEIEAKRRAERKAWTAAERPVGLKVILSDRSVGEITKHSACICGAAYELVTKDGRNITMCWCAHDRMESRGEKHTPSLYVVGRVVPVAVPAGTGTEKKPEGTRRVVGMTIITEDDEVIDLEYVGRYLKGLVKGVMRCWHAGTLRACSKVVPAIVGMVEWCGPHGGDSA
jgi:hypothetical protein